VQRSFNTAETCASFVLHHADTVPVQGELVVMEISANGNATFYQPAAIVESVETVKHWEVGCDFRYTLVFNGPWQNTP
jgi:hypothetical protein